MSEEKEEVKPVEELKIKGGAFIVSIQDHKSISGNHNIVRNTIAKVITGGERTFKSKEWVIRLEGIGTPHDNSYFLCNIEVFRLATPQEIKFYKEREDKLVSLPVLVAGDVAICKDITYTTNYTRRLEPGTKVIVEDSVISLDPYQSIFFVEGHPNAYRIMDFELCQETQTQEQALDPVAQALKDLNLDQESI